MSPVSFIRCCCTFSFRRAAGSNHGLIQYPNFSTDCKTKTETRTDDDKPDDIPQETKLLLQPRTLTIVDINAARKVAEMVQEALEDDIPLLEMHPGPGLVTEELLKAGIRNIFCYEQKPNYVRHLKQVFQKYNLENNLINESIHSLFHKEGKFPSPENVDLRNILPFNQTKDWNDTPAFSIVGAHCNFKLWIWMLLNISILARYHNIGRPQLIMAFPREEWQKHCLQSMKKCKGRHPAGSLFPDFFEWKTLGDVPRNAFMPKRLRRKSSKSDQDKELMDMMCISPIQNLFNLIDWRGLKELLYFIDQHLNGIGKRKYIIPTLERWIPGCGKTLVLNGFDVTSRFDDLSGQEILSLFMCFKSHPEYEVSAFPYAVRDEIHTS